MDTLKCMIDDIKKDNVNDSSFDLVSHLIKEYYLHAYNGKELDFTFFLYFESLWWELTFWLGKNVHGADIRSELSIKEVLDKLVLNAKIVGYDRRLYLAECWKSRATRLQFLGEITYNNIVNNIAENKLLKSLYITFHELDQTNDVLEALALDTPLKELKKQLKRMK